jgi:adenylyltransferase/sulfurtransferase
LLAGIGEPLSGRLLLWNALTMTTRTVRFAADPASRNVTQLPPEAYGETCSVLEGPTPDEISPEELRAQLASAQLIDVREDWERVLSAILPSAHAPLARLHTDSARAALASLDPRRPTIVYCAVGVRSLAALPLLRAQHGFTAVTSLRGGLKAWQQSSA